MRPQSLMDIKKVDDLKNYVDEGLKNKTSTFFSKLFSQEDCPQEDCEELTSPCCSKKLNTIFGSFPVKVECELCKMTFLLKEVLKQEGIIKV